MTFDRSFGLNHRSWIADEVRDSICGELAAAFETELTEHFGTSDFRVDKTNFEFVCQELIGYDRETLKSALPYVLIGIFRWNELSADDSAALSFVVAFLNVRSYPYSDPRGKTGDWESALKRAQEKEETVACFSDRQAHAIRLWLDAVCNSDTFFTGESANRDVHYAIAYWIDRE
ncbi:MAG: hypothetical protein LLG00_14845 [Planctomycetaceae bacterium]|nr:hypothetical protein [Planctomycetaceae bacterium]